MDKRNRFRQQYPSTYFLDASDIAGLDAYIKARGLLGEEEKIMSADALSGGNMNYVLRATTSKKSLILKQARPWVEKFPQIAAPMERNLIEAKFYEEIRHDSHLAQYAPLLLDSNPAAHILIMEDLGDTQDFSYLYQSGQYASEENCKLLGDFLSRLHRLVPKSFPDNLEMRQLNHQHIFDLPFRRDNGFDLDAIQNGLASVAEYVYSEPKVIQQAALLGDHYLSSGTSLIHGDFYPGSWMNSDGGLYVLDPEFCFVGPREFDISVLLAHFRLSGQTNLSESNFLSYYLTDQHIDWKLVEQFAAVEIIRRLVGIAQLPLDISITQKENFIKKAVEELKH